MRIGRDRGTPFQSLSYLLDGNAPSILRNPDYVEQEQTPGMSAGIDLSGGLIVPYMALMGQQARLLGRHASRLTGEALLPESRPTAEVFDSSSAHCTSS